MKNLRFMALIVLVVLGQAQAASRKVLALYKSSEGDGPRKSLVHQVLEQPLEELGLTVDYRDIDAGLPGDSAMEAYKGVITFFTGEEIDQPARYAAWVKKQIQAGRRFVILGQYGAFRDRATQAFVSYEDVNQAFGAMGLHYEGFWTENPRLIQVIELNSEMTGWEEALREDEITSYVQIQKLNSNATSYLTLARRDRPDSQSALIAVSTAGGMALNPYLFYEYQQEGLEKHRWHLNASRFLEESLGIEKTPRLQLASLNGRRLWMADVDGDGFLTPSDNGKLCGDVMDQVVFSAFPLPITAAFIVKELRDNPSAWELVDKIRQRKHMDVASHTDSHPMDWNATELNLQKEIDGSLDALKTHLLTWPGLCNPTPEALAHLEKIGGMAINGFNGDGGFVNRYDRAFPSRSYLAPATDQVGGVLQYNDRAANDYELGGDYHYILETLENIQAKNIDIPFHLYFHFYSARTRDSLQDLTRVFDWSLRQNISPVRVQDYLRIVRDFQSARLESAGPDQFRVRNSGWCRTVFFPRSNRQPDMKASRGVLGFNKTTHGLQVFLDETTDHLIVLTDNAPINADRYALASASGWVEQWTEKDGTLSFISRGFGPQTFQIAPPTGSKFYRVSWNKGFKAVASNNGVLTFQLEGSGETKIRIKPAGPLQAASVMGGPPLLIVFLIAYAFFFIRKKGRRLQ